MDERNKALTFDTTVVNAPKMSTVPFPLTEPPVVLRMLMAHTMSSTLRRLVAVVASASAWMAAVGSTEGCDRMA